MAKNPRLIDLTGQKFGLWTVQSQSGNNQKGAALWRCSCDCGETAMVIGSDLRAGKSRSCGCQGSRTKIGNLNKTHGETGTSIYVVWNNMRSRCLNPKRKQFKDYGGRGIRVCDEWNDFPTFMEWAISSGYREGLSIERIEVNGGYAPDNCTWATAAEQSANRRFVAKNKEGKLWWHVARDNGITNSAYRTRLHDGWDIEEAATWPMGVKRSVRPRNDKGQFI